MSYAYPKPDADRWLTLPSSAQALRMPWSRAYSMVCRGELEAHQVAGRWLVSKASVDRLLAERERGE